MLFTRNVVQLCKHNFCNNFQSAQNSLNDVDYPPPSLDSRTGHYINAHYRYINTFAHYVSLSHHRTAIERSGNAY